MYVSVLFMNETEIRVNQGRGKLKVKLARIVVDSFFFLGSVGKEGIVNTRCKLTVLKMDLAFSFQLPNFLSLLYRTRKIMT